MSKTTDKPPTQAEFEAFLKTPAKRATKETYKKYAKSKKLHVLEMAALTCGYEPPPKRFLPQLWAAYVKQQQEREAKAPS